MGPTLGPRSARTCFTMGSHLSLIRVLGLASILKWLNGHFVLWLTALTLNQNLSVSQCKEVSINSALEKAAFSVEEAGTYLGTSRPTIYRPMDSGDLPSIHIGRRRLVLKEDLDKFIQERKAEAEA